MKGEERRRGRSLPQVAGRRPPVPHNIQPRPYGAGVCCEFGDRENGEGTHILAKYFIYLGRLSERDTRSCR